MILPECDARPARTRERAPELRSTAVAVVGDRTYARWRALAIEELTQAATEQLLFFAQLELDSALPSRQPVEALGDDVPLDVLRAAVDGCGPREQEQT